MISTSNASQVGKLALSRRRFLTVLAGTAVIGACSNELTNSSSQREADSQTVRFVEPEALRSANGTLDVTLTAAPAAFPGASAGLLAYNQAPTGPTLRVRPGDRIQLTLRNELGVSTNLHTHGLAVSPSGQADDVFAVVDNGTDRTYVYDIPDNHRSGTFWYHPHLHGAVAAQVAAGLFGVIIVEDDLDDTDEMRALPERLLVFNDPSPADRKMSPMDGMHGRSGAAMQVNGRVEPVLTMTVGAIERWRLVNASASRPISLSVPSGTMHLIASDGGRLEQPLAVDRLVLVPGERAEVIVELPGAAGSVPIGDGGQGRPLMLVSLAEFEPTTSAVVPSRLAAASELAAQDADRKRTVTFGAAMGSGSMMSGNGAMQFTIDGQVFDPQRTDIEVAAGSIEDWTIVNTTGMDHPFHLHAWAFHVLGDGGWPGWKDTVNVPGGGEVTIRIPFVGPTGRTVYHCHILDHEDLGMMGVIDVRPA
jgi:FtsP/CotA-like multicopper oxidase with cupredoxin domain